MSQLSCKILECGEFSTFLMFPLVSSCGEAPPVQSSHLWGLTGALGCFLPLTPRLSCCWKQDGKQNHPREILLWAGFELCRGARELLEPNTGRNYSVCWALGSAALGTRGEFGFSTNKHLTPCAEGGVSLMAEPG